MREGTTSRVKAADRPYGKSNDFYSVSPETFGSTLVQNNYSGLNASLFWTLFIASDILLAPFENGFQSTASDGIL